MQEIFFVDRSRDLGEISVRTLHKVEKETNELHFEHSLSQLRHRFGR